MSQLVGAWLCEGGSAVERVGAGARRAMLDVIEARPEELRELDRGRLWLCAHPARLVTEGERVLALEGFVAIGERSLAELLLDTAAPEGGYVLARSDGRELRLSRSISGGERLYLASVGKLVLFACSLRPLLAHPAIGRSLDADVARDVLLSGHPIRGTATPIRGIDEVLPGHTARVDRSVVQDWHRPDVLRSPEGPRDVSARRFRERLADAVARSIGPKRPVAIALSGGIDSSAVAAALVEVVGADDVHAFSYEFDDPTHPVETEHARSVVRRLGIRRHEVFPIRFADFLDAIPEHVWRSESAVHWPKAFLLPVARHLAAAGFDRYLTGFGIGSHMGYLGEFSSILPYLPKPELSLRYWSWVRFGGWDVWTRLAALHPGLEPPHPRLFHLLVELLEARGVLSDRRRFYPPELLPLLRSRRDAWSGRIRERLEREALSHLLSCIDVTRSEKASRELGVLRISPAHFDSCIPYAYFPPAPLPGLLSSARRLRPGKLLLRDAYRGILPDSVLFRKKSWDDAVVSRAWRKRGRIFMLRALPHHPGDLEELGPGIAAAVEEYEPMSIQAGGLAFRLWIELFVKRAPTRDPPTWRELWGTEPSALRARPRAPPRGLP